MTFSSRSRGSRLNSRFTFTCAPGCPAGGVSPSRPASTVGLTPLSTRSPATVCSSPSLRYRTSASGEIDKTSAPDSNSAPCRRADASREPVTAPIPPIGTSQGFMW
ncbi:Uncharacterised protein [Mycobacteroides abscessus subsp. abscessus]|nr:Uncharacterised protein [Mycobacteroides abscessus subsp. abscessus]